MATVQELMKLGEQMNLSGTDLKEFIREQQILAREEREKERERERREKKKGSRKRKKEREREREKREKKKGPRKRRKERERERKRKKERERERRARKRKREREIEREERERIDREKDRQFEMERLKLMEASKRLELQAKLENPRDRPHVLRKTWTSQRSSHTGDCFVLGLCPLGWSMPLPHSVASCESC